MEKAVIFDLDGTMWDASETVTDAFNIRLAQMGIQRRITVEEMMGQMGRTLEEIASVFFGSVDPENAVNIMRSCTDYENQYIKTAGGRVYPGLERTLEGLKEDGWGVICVSNCQSGYIESFIDYLGLDGVFDDIECWGNTGLGKAENIKLVIQRNHVNKAVYVGDTMGDYNSALEAGADFIHAAYGYGTVPEGTKSIASPEELLGLLRRLYSKI
ncbi:MAG TPA: HAD family hydrolase [Candidatus Faeciplasma avium]|uniref:HAD family hydrolase n=1 Tax=Candidatus Faeciplasma avium TaxID=2840798 RepID=A0A9D1NP77_9FIRM|nr:HAD family hydrolase [Candidatus Faeciplasma avium]